MPTETPEPMQAAPDPHGSLTEKLQRQEREMLRMVQGLDEESLRKRTIPEKWSLKELACHLWRVQKLFADRMEAMLTQDNPTITSYHPEGDAEFAHMLEQPG